MVSSLGVVRRVSSDLFHEGYKALLFVTDLIVLIFYDIATGYWADQRGSIPGRRKRFLSTPQRPDRL
jgi:uncharacterized membrane protein